MKASEASQTTKVAMSMAMLTTELSGIEGFEERLKIIGSILDTINEEFPLEVALLVMSKQPDSQFSEELLTKLCEGITA